MHFKKAKKDIFSGLQKNCFSPFLFSQISSNSIPELHFWSDIASTKCFLYYFMSSVAARWFILFFKSHLIQCSHIEKVLNFHIKLLIIRFRLFNLCMIIAFTVE